MNRQYILTLNSGSVDWWKSMSLDQFKARKNYQSIITDPAIAFKAFKALKISDKEVSIRV